MNAGRWIVVGLAAFCVVAGAGLYYLQGYHYYERVEGVAEIEIGGEPFGVSDYVGLDNAALPLRLRGCFRLDAPDAAIAAGPSAKNAAPFAAPSWFDCWDPAQIDADLEAGRAVAVSAETAGEGDFATERIVVVYPDGRAFQWRRLASEGL